MASLLLLAMLACATTLASSAAGVRVGLTRIHSNLDIRGALRRDMHRRARFGRSLASSDGTVAAPVQRAVGNGEFVMTLAIGTPPLAYPAIADTGSDLIWTQCAPCGSQCFKQPTPLYDPASSSTFSVLPCNNSLSMCADTSSTFAACQSSQCGYNYTYGTGWTAGIQGVETFTFGSTPADQSAVSGVAFGCSHASSDRYFTGSAGLVGLGRGSMSLASQLGVGKFSYCLTTFDDLNSTSTLLLGPSAVLNDAGISSTPFVPSSSHYYLNLTGISLGATLLPIPRSAFSLGTDGPGGVIIDSGTTITSLVDAAYQPVRAAVQSLLTLPVVNGSDNTGFNLCFQLPSQASAPPSMPNMTFHFDGADMVLPPENYMIFAGPGVWCLAMASYEGISIFGNYQQQNMHILYDVHNEMLSFAPADCSTL